MIYKLKLFATYFTYLSHSQRTQFSRTGFTLQQVTTEPKLSPDHTWCKADFRQFNVRIGPDYNRHKKKAPSAAPIYEPFAVDVFW